MLYLQKLVFLYLSKVTRPCFSSAPGDVTKMTPMLRFLTPQSPFKACNALLWQIVLGNDGISNMSKDNKEGKLPKKTLFLLDVDLL